MPFHNWLCELKYFSFSFTWSMRYSVENVQLKYQWGRACIDKTVHYNCNTTILLRRELRTSSYLVSLNFTKYLRKAFEICWNDYIWLLEYGKIYTNNKCYVKECILKSFWNSTKLLASPFLLIFQTFSYSKTSQREIGHSNGTWALVQSRHLGTRGTQGTWELGHSGT